MIEFARNSIPVCSHCGKKITELKYSNVDHIIPKSKAPSLIDKPFNLRILCDDLDWVNDSRESRNMGCHTIRHAGSIRDWEERRDKYK